MPGQQRLCGPEGTGALYVRGDRCEELAHTFIGYYPMKPGAEDFQPFRGGKCFEVGGQNLVDLAGPQASLARLESTVGMEFAYARTARLAALARELLASCPVVSARTAAAPAGLVYLTVDGVSPTDVVEALASEQIIVRSIANPACCRIATGFFNTEEELARLATALRAISRTSSPNNGLTSFGVVEIGAPAYNPLSMMNHDAGRYPL